MGKSSTPKAPNYERIAELEAQGNLDLARYATQANRVNQYTPWGSLTWSNDRVFDQAGWDAAMQAYNQSIQSSGGGTSSPFSPGPGGLIGMGTITGPDGRTAQIPNFVADFAGLNDPAMNSVRAPISAPNRDDFWSSGDNWSQHIELSPELQQMLDQQNRIQLGLFGAQDAALGRVNQTMASGFNTSGLPSGGTALNIGSLPGLGDVLDPSRLPAMGSVLNINSLPQAGTAFTPTGEQLAVYDPTLNTNNATELMMQRINPQMDRQQEALRAQLANQGIVQGTEAYDRAMMQHQQGRNDAYNQAALTGIGLGMQQQGLMFNQGLQNRQLTAAEQAQQFGQQGYLRELAAQLQAQQYGQQTGNRMLGASEQAQRYGQQTTNQQLAAALQAQQFAQSEQARQRAFQEAAYQRSLPFQELMALTSGSNVQMPQFPGYSQQATTGGPQLLNASQMGYQTALNASNAQNAQQANFMSGLFGLGGTLIGGPAGAAVGAIGGLFSDRRLKRNIKRVGTADNGLAIYSYEYVWGGPVQLGYMADEVEQIAPHAVGNVAGFQTVNYGAI